VPRPDVDNTESAANENAEPIDDAPPPRRRVIGRYVLHDEIAAGGMATVHIGRLLAPVGFSRTVAIKCLHPQFAKDPEFVSMFLDEARLAARIRHPNVVATLDVVALRGELFLVMEFVQGESLSRLVRHARETRGSMPLSIVVSVMSGMLQGLHAAHEACNERGEPLDVVHRDVSPQNVLVGIDGVARVLDFGVAKAIGRLQTTRDGQIKGKTAYMSPEQIQGREVDRRTDVYAASVVAWEALTGRRLFVGDSAAEIMNQILEKKIEPPSRHAPEVPRAVDAIVLRGLSRRANDRLANALEMSAALENAVVPATSRQVGEWVKSIAGDVLDERAARVHAIEREAVGESEVVVRGKRAPRDEAATIVERGERKVDGETATSSVSMATPAELTRKGRKRGVVIVGVAAAMLIGGGIWIAMREGDRSPAPTTSSAPASTTTSSTPSTSTMAVTSSSSSSPSAAPTAAPIPSPMPPTTSSAPPSATTKPKAKPKPATTKPTNKPKPSCSPPYTIDPDGVHIPKPECG
jgi:serine/threonine-protein kinase